jgi:O-antigen ligase
MGMNEVAVDAARCAPERPEEERDTRDEPGARAEVPDDSVPVGDPEMPERGGRHDGDGNAAPLELIDGVSNEPTRTVAGVSGVRRREDKDLHAGTVRRDTDNAVVKATVVPLALVPALGAVQGGFQPDSWVWAGALAAWAAAVALVASSSPGLLRTQWPWAAAAVGLLVWTALSATWSSRTSQSILEARRSLLYAAVVLALVLLARQGATRVLVLATCGGTAGLVTYALVRYLLSTRHYDTFEGYSLNQPLGYANAVGILAAIATLLALGVAEQERGKLRLVAAATVPPLVLALTLTASDASWLALGAGTALIAVMLPDPQRLLVVLAAVAIPSAALIVLGKVSDITAVVTTPRIGGAVIFLAALVGAAAAAATLAHVRRVHVRAPHNLRRAILTVTVVLALGGAVAVAAHAGATEPRRSYYSVAWHEYTAHPVLGSGAGTYGFAWARSGKELEFGGALDAHSIYLETLAELGPIGLGLMLLLLLIPFRALRVARTPYVAAAFGGYVAFLIHAGLDWDWELPAIVVAALACGTAALAALPATSTPLDRRRRFALVVVALVLAGCAIAGARSNAVPSAHTTRAPL